MAIAGVIVALALIVSILIDAFEVMILPRRIRHGFRLSRTYYRLAWTVWVAGARLFSHGWLRYGFLSAFGPLSLFGLLSVWAVGLIAGFALLHAALGTDLSIAHQADHRISTYFYFSGTTFFTLGYGDIVPTQIWGRLLSVVEAGVGFGFLAIVISYLPVLYQAFSRREISISLLDARAGSPPSAGELLRRLGAGNVRMESLLIEWERWSAELLESHVSFPVLRFYRSQHDNQSWVATLTTILDTSALLIAGVDEIDDNQARLTFAMARHAAVDLGLVSQLPPVPLESDRLPPDDFVRLYGSLRTSGLRLRPEEAMATALGELRALYEPFVNSLSHNLRFELPKFDVAASPVDNWQRSPWMPRSPNLGALPTAQRIDREIH